MLPFVVIIICNFFFSGIHLSDLVYIDENTDFVGETLINFKKHHLVTTSIGHLLHHQHSSGNSGIPEEFMSVQMGNTDEIPHLEKIEPLFTFLSVLPYLNDKEMYKMSLEREPRGATIREIVM